MTYGLLTDEALSGAVGVQRWLATERSAHLVNEADLSDVGAAVTALCNTWGGGYHMLVPIQPQATEVPEPWITLIEDTRPSRIAARGQLPVPPPGTIVRGGAVWVEHSSGEMPLAVLARTDKPEGGFRTVRTADGIDASDPWAVAYTAVWGLLPEALDREQLRWARLREDVRYEDLMPVDRAVPTAPGAADLLAVVRDPAVMTAVNLSCARLGWTIAPTGSQFPETPPLLPTRFERARDCGPNLVVVYEPGSAADLCLLWHLRSVHGLRAGFPLGVPVTADVAAALANWWGEYAMLSWGLRTTTGHLVSASVDLNQLEQLAATAGAQWSAVPWQEVLQPNRGCGIGSMEVALFDSGQATLSAVHPAETAALGPDVIAEVGQALELMATPSGQMLPPSSTLAREGYFAKYREGAIVPRGDYRTAATMVWPTGLSVLDAVVRDLGFRATPSAPGRLAETLLRRTATLGGLAPLLHPNMQAMLARLGSRHGMNWFKDHLRQALNVDVEGNEAVGERLAAMEERLRQLAGRPSEEEQTDVTFDDVRAQLNNDRTAAHAWLNWADQAGLILRGAQVQCTHCTRRSWRPLNELAPPVVCRGCGEAIERPYGYDQVKFRFRATELLLGLVKDDAVVHALALRFLSELFRPSFNTVGPILGGYPGVTIRRPGVSDPLGEADVLFVMIDGRVGVGECKVRANGLVEEEVAKLARLSHALSASWTFTATLDRAAACGPLWRVNPNGERVPHFALTAEHLYDSLPIAALGTDPLSWRTSYNSLGAHGAISDEQHQSEFVATVRDMDEWRLKRQLPAWRARD